MRYILRLLTVFVLLALNALPVSALSYGLYVCGQQVVGNDSTFNVTEDGKIKYDPSTRTLTLRNVVIRDSVCAIHNARIDGLTILLEGTDSIFITGADALLLERRTVIRSATHDGLLCISTSKAKGATTSDDAAVRVSGGSTLSITDCYVKISSDGYALKSIKADSLAITAAALLTAKSVKGRAEVVPTDGDYTILIDYAVTPDAVENILVTVRAFTKGRLVFLFGCGGDRDRLKRPIMGRIAGEKADFVIVTSDNPRTEDPMAIINEILPGLKKTHTSYVVKPDRRDAIRYAIENHRSGDVIILCGKGHEDYQIIGHEKIHIDEREIVAEILAKRKEQQK